MRGGVGAQPVNEPSDPIRRRRETASRGMSGPWLRGPPPASFEAAPTGGAPTACLADQDRGALLAMSCLTRSTETGDSDAFDDVSESASSELRS